MRSTHFTSIVSKVLSMRPSLRLLLVLPLAVLLAAPAAAQSNAERIANDWYTRSHDYDLIHQRIAVRNFDWDSTSFDGAVTTTLVALKPALDSIVLDAGHLLTIHTVKDARGTSLRFTTHGDTLVVFPARPVGFHDSLTFAIAYHAKIDNGRGLTFITPDGRPHRPQQIWSQGEDHNNHDWFPTYDFPNDKMTWEMDVTIPRKYTAVSNGSLVSDRPVRGGEHTLVWRQAEPASTYLVSLIVAPLVKFSDHWKQVPVDYYVYHSDSANAWRLFHQTTDMIDTYSRLTGVPYPWQKYAETTVADFFGGMENVSATTLVDWLPDARAYQDRPWYQWILIPHELAHQWFGDDVTTENWANMWLNEGFAEFMPGQYWLTKLGKHAADDYYLDEYHQYMQIDQRRRMPLASLGSNDIYPKGALVLRMLKNYLGPDRFWASLHRYLVDHKFDNATTDDMRQAVLDATGENLDWFWSEWIYQAGYPEFVVTATYDSTAHTVSLDVKQTQVDTTKPDSTGLFFTTPLVFKMPVTVRVGTARGDVFAHAQLDQREQTITVPHVMSAPTMVVFDDGNTILKKLSFDQPTPWLATQLREDASLWDREWVIDQLAQRAADTTRTTADRGAAATALADAATGADYFLTRSQACDVLAGLGADVALSPLEAATRDTSAQVRAAAVDALGQVGGAKAIALMTAALNHDSSYAVEAAAVRGLALAGAPDMHALIVRALAMPSYRDEVQNAALFAIARSNDTSFVGTVDSLVPMSQTAPQVLGVLAGRGSDRALDLLVGHLNDASPSVRRSAVFAFMAMPPAQAIAKLESVQGSLTHADTQAQVKQAIERIKERQQRAH